MAKRQKERFVLGQKLSGTDQLGPDCLSTVFFYNRIVCNHPPPPLLKIANYAFLPRSYILRNIDNFGYNTHHFFQQKDW
jgi:hypothetical protein